MRVPFQLIHRDPCNDTGTRYLLKDWRAFEGTKQDFKAELRDKATWQVLCLIHNSSADVWSGAELAFKGVLAGVLIQVPC